MLPSSPHFKVYAITTSTSSLPISFSIHSRRAEKITNHVKWNNLTLPLSWCAWHEKTFSTSFFNSIHFILWELDFQQRWEIHSKERKRKWKSWKMLESFGNPIYLLRIKNSLLTVDISNNSLKISSPATFLFQFKSQPSTLHLVAFSCCKLYSAIKGYIDEWEDWRIIWGTQTRV